MAHRPRALVLGDINRDLFLRVSSYPRPGGDHPTQSAWWSPGGSAVNTAAVLSALGVRTGLIGRVGPDREGQYLLRQLARMKIDTRGVQKDPELPTGLCVIPVTPDGERTLIGARGANTALARDGLLDQLDDLLHLHVSGYALLEPSSRDAALAALAGARKKGARTSLDFGWLPSTRAAGAIREALPYVSVALPTAPELRRAMGLRRLSRAAEAALDLGVEEVAASLGAGGCRVFTEGRSLRLPPFETRAVNTCGAGDAFNAGYVFARLQGAELAACAALANAAGAAAVGESQAYPTVTPAALAAVLERAARDPRYRRVRDPLEQARGLLEPKPMPNRRKR